MPSTSGASEGKPLETGVRVLRYEDPANDWQPYELIGDRTPPPATLGDAAEVWTSPDGRVTIGLWRRDADRSQLQGHGLSLDFMLEGEVSVTEPDGTRHVARAGDLLIYGSADKGQWEHTAPIRKFFVHIDTSSE